jgi:hypothetical protein
VVVLLIFLALPLLSVIPGIPNILRGLCAFEHPLWQFDRRHDHTSLHGDQDYSPLLPFPSCEMASATRNATFPFQTRKGLQGLYPFSLIENLDIVASGGKFTGKIHVALGGQ